MFYPREGDTLTIVLPAETLRALVTRVVNRDTVIVEIGQPFMRTHQFRNGDLVACRRTPGLLGETWNAIEVRPTLPDLSDEKPPDETLTKFEVTQKPAKSTSKPAKMAPKGPKKIVSKVRQSNRKGSR